MSLAEGPPDLPYPKLPFWDTVSLSYSTYFSHFIDALRASWLWLIAVAALTAVASWQQWSWMATAMTNLKPGVAPQMPKPTEMAVLLNLANIFLLLAGVSIAVAWHRLMILDERPGFSGSNVATKNVWRYIGIGILICLIVLLPAVATILPLAASTGLLPLGSLVPVAVLILILCLVGITALRLSLLLPARAVGDLSLTLKQTWVRTRGNAWRLFWGMVATTVPPSLVVQIAFLLGVGPPDPATFASGDFAARMTALSTIFNIYYLLMLPIGIGFLSHAYRHFFQAPLEFAE
jgi:hypothetical protein